LNAQVLTGRPKMKKITVLFGFSPNNDYGVFNATLRTALKAVYERMLYVKKGNEFVKPPKPLHSAIYEDTLLDVSRHFDQVKLASPLTEKEFLGTYVGRKRLIYERAFLSLRVKPLRKRDSYVNWFSKTEKQTFSGKEPVPRGISPRSPRYHVELGPYIKRIEKEIYTMLGKYNSSRVIFKGLNARDRGVALREHWEVFQNPVAIGLDASRFDQHVSLEALKWEHSIYRKYYPRDSKFAELLKMQLKNKCYVNLPDGSFQFQVEGKRMSGDMNTALGNCLIASSLVLTYCKLKGVKCRVANDGDDIVLVMERRDTRKITDLSEWFLNMGFNMKIEAPVYTFEEIEFCQAKPVWTPEGYIMTRNPYTALPKDCTSITPFQSVRHGCRWMKAVGQCGLALTGGVPIFQDFYQRLIDISGNVQALKTEEGRESGMERLARDMKRTYQLIHPRTRVSFWRAFGIEPDKQLVMESEYRNREFRKESSPDNHPIRDFPI